MSAALALMLEGMPSPWDLHLHRAAGRVVVLVGSTVVAEYAEGDLAMRNMMIVTLRRVGFGGGRVAELFGLTPTYVSRLKTAAARGSAAALASQDGPGRPRALGEDQQELARQWREQGKSDLEIGRRLGVAGTTVARRLAARAASPAAGADAGPGQEELEFTEPATEPGRDLELAPESRPEPGPRADAGQEEGPQDEEQEPGRLAGLAAEVEAGRTSFQDREAGSSSRGMPGRCCCTRSWPGRGVGGAGSGCRGIGTPDGRSEPADGRASVTSMCFALGAQTTEQVKRLTASCAGPLAGACLIICVRGCR